MAGASGRQANINQRFFSMYAVIKTGGKQYKVAAGDKLKIEQMPADIGAEITIDQVLAVGNGEQVAIGAPLVDGATVSATVLSHGQHPKVRIFKMRRRKHYRKTQGHRQRFTEIFVSRIASAIGEASADAGAVATATAATAVAAAAPAGERDDLTKVEGIGPKICQVFHDAGILTFAQLAQTPVERLKELLAAAGSRFASHDPTTWPQQAGLAASGDWDALKKLQDELDGGRPA
ncbi:MAG: 50S ribosomal protein L21 [Burkholderiaceae bacterium]|nr:50S ribosomal protein L21 [Burkholderiaceae bacterium]